MITLINEIVIDDIHRLNESYIKEGIKAWDRNEPIKGVKSFCEYIQIYSSMKWIGMIRRN